jgi:hypothetical protein
LINSLEKLKEITSRITKIKERLEKNSAAQKALNPNYTIPDQLVEEEYQLE